MNVDEAMEAAAAYLTFEQAGEPMFASEQVAVVIAAEVERLRVWNKRWRDASAKLRLTLAELSDELAAAKAADKTPPEA